MKYLPLHAWSLPGFTELVSVVSQKSARRSNERVRVQSLSIEDLRGRHGKPVGVRKRPVDYRLLSGQEVG